jgi:hypothetical protein
MLSRSLKEIVGQDYLAVFPSGWEARPWDNIYHVANISNEDTFAFFDLAENWSMRAPKECRYFSIGLNIFIFLRNASLSCPVRVKNYTKGIFCLIQPDWQEQQRIFEIYKTLDEEILSL